MRVWSYPGIYPYPDRGDLTSGIFIHKQNLGLKNIGLDVRVVQYQDWAPLWPFYKIFGDWHRAHVQRRPWHRSLEGIPIYHPKVFTPKPSRLFRRPHSHYLVETLVDFFKKQGVKRGHDILHAQWLIPDGHIAVQVAHKLGIACSVEMQGDDIVVWPHKSATHHAHALWTLEHADLVSGCSNYLSNLGKSLYEKPIDIHTIYTGVDHAKFIPLANPNAKKALRKKYDISADDLVILNVGSAIERKGWLELFEAVSLLKGRYPHIKIVAASGGLQDFKLADKALSYGITDQLIDLGAVKNEQLLELYQLCDIFALPSYWEGLANVLCEAMACGCAVVTTAVAGHPEVVKDGVNGFLIAPKNVEMLKNALDRLITSETLRKEMGSEARNTAVQHIGSHEANAGKLLKLFEKVI